MKKSIPLLLLGLLAAGCSQKSEPEEVAGMIQAGSQVKIHYTLTVDGNVLDSSVGKEPLAFVQGSGSIIPGLDEQLLGLRAGEKKSCTVPPEKGYGSRNPQALQAFPKAEIPDADNLKAGDTVQGMVQGQPFVATVQAIGENEITLDLNHPLAGKTLNFDVEVVEVVNAPAPQGT